MSGGFSLPTWTGVLEWLSSVEGPAAPAHVHAWHQLLNRIDQSGHYATVFIIVSGKLIAASVNVKNAVKIGKACMPACENKLPQGFHIKISSYGVTMDTPMKVINMGAVTTVDIEVRRYNN